jgi:hypothetical protein
LIETLEQEQKAIQSELRQRRRLPATTRAARKQLALRSEKIEDELMQALERWDAPGPAVAATGSEFVAIADLAERP